MENEIMIGMAKLCTAFPKMEKGFWNILVERIIANNFTKERLKKAVEHILDNFQYKELNVADIIRYDRRVKLYSFKQYVDMIDKGFKGDDFETKKIDGKHYWYLKVDLLND